MRDVDLAWAAGFVDGEGTITLFLHKRLAQIYIVLSAGNTDPRPLHVLQEMFGGNVSLHKRANATHKTFYTWWLGHRKAANAIRTIEPYLRVKREQAQIAI